jgi:hypothetical protein
MVTANLKATCAAGEKSHGTRIFFISFHEAFTIEATLE